MIKLTDKERRFIELRAQGFTDKEICKMVFLNRQYVKNVFSEIYKKTGCRNGPHLVNWAWSNGVLKINCQKYPSQKEEAA